MKELICNLWHKIKTSRYFFIGIAVVAFIIGFSMHSGHPPAGGPETGSHQDHSAGEKKAVTWTCSMHPQIKLPKPGKCPICGMDLIPLKMDEGEDTGVDIARLTISESAKKLAEIVTSPVERKIVNTEVRLVGKVVFDETRLAYITAWVPGRLDRLYVDFTGVEVKKGDHLVYLYSPELLSAQEELLQAVQAVKNLGNSQVEVVKDTALLTVEAVKERLRLWGLNSEQIAEIEKKGTPSDHITIYAPLGGVVVHKNAVEGMYVQTGTRIYTIADLSQVWIKLDAYESDLMWVRYGQEVEFTTEAYPGETFKGRISFIDPVLNPKTRTVKLRVDVPNMKGKLKPEMFVRAIVRANVAGTGKVMEPALANKWICPMHPNIIKEEKGICDICQMDLVTTESMGYVSTEETEIPLVIPATAPLITGKRAVVYVEVLGKNKPTYEGREVVLGPRATSTGSDYYLVSSGLLEGERVVTKGNFKIDSALQIQAKPSMMNPTGGGPVPGHHHGSGTRKSGGQIEGSSTEETDVLSVPDEFHQQLTNVFKDYVKLQKALAGDDFDQAKKDVQSMENTLSNVDMALLKGPAHMVWMKILKNINKGLKSFLDADDIKAGRVDFAAVSEQMTIAFKKFGVTPQEGVYRFQCPMAFEGEGGYWLQDSKETANPYFGQMMPGCGDMVETLGEK